MASTWLGTPLAQSRKISSPRPRSPQSEGNPNYHQMSDTFVDPEYAADIARVDSAAAWATANT